MQTYPTGCARRWACTLESMSTETVKPFRCVLCGANTTVRGRRSWLTIAIELVSLTFLLDMWFSYCVTCARKLNQVAAILAVILVIAAVAAFVATVHAG